MVTLGRAGKTTKSSSLRSTHSGYGKRPSLSPSLPIQVSTSEDQESATFPRFEQYDTGTRRSFNFANDSLSLFPTASYTNVTGTPSTHSRTIDNASYLETVSPISRSSLEFPFRSKSRTSISTDPIARAAAVQAARQAFEDRELAKARKLEKAQEKELRRWDWRKPEQQQPKQRCTHLADLSHDRRGISSESRSRSKDSGHRSCDLYLDAEYYGSNEKSEVSSIKKLKSAWLLFLTWLRTRIFKMGRRIKKKSG